MTDYAGDLRRLCDKCVHNFGVCPPCEDCDGQEYFEAEEDRTMKEIMGENLEQLLSSKGYNAKRTFSGKIGYWDNLEVWEVDGETFERLCGMDEEKWREAAGDGAWFRHVEGSILGVPSDRFVINNKEIIAWRNEDRYEDIREGYYTLDEDEQKEYDSAKEYADILCKYRYDNLMEYLCDELGASTAKNVCALAIDLAKYNHMSLGKLFEVYGQAQHEGGSKQ